MSVNPKRMAGPAIHAVDPWMRGDPQKRARHQLLSDDERAQLAKISSIVRFEKGEQIYLEGDRADAAFNIISGVVTAYRAVEAGARVVTSFLYPGDLFGLSEEGIYSGSTKATTFVVAYKMPLEAVRRVLRKNADLDVGVIIKLCEELREAQHHAVLLAQKKAVSRLARFLELQEHLQFLSDGRTIFLPMKRSEIGDYLGLTPAAVSRAFRTLVLKKIISDQDLHHVKIVNRNALYRIADSTSR